MFDRRAKREEFRAALLSNDPFVFGRCFRISVVANNNNNKNGSGGGNGNHGSSSSSSAEKLNEYGIEWTSVLKPWLDVCHAAQSGDAVRCYDRQAALHSAFNQIFATSAGNWFVPALHAVCHSTRRIAVAADYAAARKQQHQQQQQQSRSQQQQSRSSGNNNNNNSNNNNSNIVSDEHVKLENAATLLQESFSRTFNDRKEYVPGAPFSEDGSKKAGVLQIVNELFAVYFQLNTLRLCKNLVKPVERMKLHDNTAVQGQTVTYRYYVGRLALFEDNYAQAEEHLEYAAATCHSAAVRNKRRILRYLIPVKLFRGQFPTAELLTKYQLHEFVPIVAGIRKGDLRTFQDALVDYQDRFIRQGTYLLLEKCKTVCYRNLYKRIHAVLAGRTQISLCSVQAAFKWLGVPIDLDEVECITANLIYRGYVRGYLSHAKRVLVLSKRDPFPVSAVVVLAK